nr:hypothetical protein [Helicobacter sp. NHP21005]
MAQNLADGGKRQFILIQLDEPIDPKKSPNAYNFCQQELGHAKPTIFDITQERLKRAKAKLEQEHAGQTSDLNFKVFRVQEKGACLEDIATFQAQELNFPTYSQTSLLTTWMAYDGISLSLEPMPILLATYTAFLCASRLYLLSPNFDMPALKALLEKFDNDPSFKPSVIVACNEEIDSPMQRALCENLKALNNRKNLEIKTFIRLAHGKL